MAQPLLSRKYSLTIGLPSVTTITSKVVTEEEVIGINLIPNEQDYRTVTLRAVEITDSHIEARISSSSKGTGKNTISIYNLSEETREIVEKVNNYVIFKAGYESDEELGIILTGQVSEVYTETRGQDLVTKLVVGEGYIPNNSVRLSKAFPEKTTADTVVKFLIEQYKKAGVPLGQYTPQASENDIVDYVQLRRPTETVYEMGYSLNGYLSDELNRICKSMGYTNYITNGRLFIHPTYFTATTERYQLSLDNIYSVKPSKTNASSPNSKNNNGVVIRTQLDSRIGVDKQVEIMEGDYKGVYKVLSCEFDINYRSGNYETVISCKSING